MAAKRKDFFYEGIIGKRCDGNGWDVMKTSITHSCRVEKHYFRQFLAS